MTSKVPTRVGQFEEDHFEAVKNEIDAQPDRGAAIIAGALLDEHLRWAIDCRFIELSSDDARSIFEGLAPLASFEARRRMGFAMGLFDRDAREELRIIGKIRNRFAHTIAPIDFKDSVVAECCGKLLYPQKHAAILGKNATSREKYLHSCWVLRAVVTSQATKDDKPDGPNHERFLGAWAEALSASLSPDKSA